VAGSVAKICGAETQSAPEYRFDSFSSDGLHTPEHR
jgi:hypothetical protein